MKNNQCEVGDLLHFKSAEEYTGPMRVEYVVRVLAYVPGNRKDTFIGEVVKVIIPDTFSANTELKVGWICNSFALDAFTLYESAPDPITQFNQALDDLQIQLQAL